eukprot:m.49154 g.49154  ORF g.49154 m.49154 type:complete len:663 (-) comp7438_c1_seq1:22-2010(-)
MEGQEGEDLHASRNGMLHDVSLKFENVTWFAPKSKENRVSSSVAASLQGRKILCGVSGEVNPGEVLAILGPSGAGKTTLFNIICGRLQPHSGDIFIGNNAITKKLRRNIGFVMQADVLFANLSVRETMHYAALLRFPCHLSETEKLVMADQMIVDLGLSKCADSFVGNDVHRGISGGEKRRLNIGTELLGDPPILVLDEPTSGLDSASAASLIATLRELASRQHRTILMTVHQPSSQIYNQFDKLLLLSHGEVAFFGSSSDAKTSFQKAGLSCPNGYNMADFFLDVLSSPTLCEQYIRHQRLKQEQSTNGVRNVGGIGNALLHTEDGSSVNDSSGIMGSLETVLVDDTESLGKKMTNTIPAAASSFNSINPLQNTSFFRQVSILTSRGFKQNRGEVWTSYNMAQGISLSVTAGLAWFQLPKTEESLNDRFGFLFFGIIFWSLRSILTASHTFPPERAVVRKEYASGIYRLSAYLAAKSISEVPIMILMPGLYWVISYWMAGFDDVGIFFLSLLALLYNVVAAHSIGLFFSALFMDIKKATVVSTVVLLTSMFLAGFYVQHLPPWMTWAKYLAFMYYGYNIQLSLEFEQTGYKLACDEVRSSFPICGGRNSSSNPYVITGQDVIDRYGINSNNTMNVFALLAFIVIFRVCTYFALKQTLSTMQ